MKPALSIATIIAVVVVFDWPGMFLLAGVVLLAAAGVFLCAVAAANAYDDDWCRAVDAETERRNRLRGES